MAQVVKNPPANAEGLRDSGSIPGSGRSPGGGQENPLQRSCLENPMDRGAWTATVHRATKSQAQLKQLSTQDVFMPPKLILEISGSLIFPHTGLTENNKIL